MSKATIDFETRSACPIRKTGSWRYSLDPTTEILCLAYRLPYWAPGVVALWHPAFPQINMPASEDIDTLLELMAWIESGQLVEAHNAWFERGIWTNIFVPMYGASPIQHSQWRCSAAKAAAHALPRALEDATKALRLSVQKDTEGSKVMKKLAKPRKPRKKERETWAKEHGSEPHPIVYHESKALFERLFTYCQQDILAEEALSESIPDLSPEETEIYLLDQAMNERGFQLDTTAITTALTLIEKETRVLNLELTELTGGQVKKATQRAQMLKWFQEAHGLQMFDTQAETVDRFLSTEEVGPVAHRALDIVRMLGRSSTAKYETMRHWSCPDARVRGGLQYHGAATGRWAGSGVQPHNFPRGKIKDWDMEHAWAVLKTQDRDEIVGVFGSVMEPLSQGLRGAIIAGTDQHLFVADYASIEARVLFWLARDLEALEVFRTGEDIYLVMAAEIYDRPVGKDEIGRQLGKAAILGLGYQMGATTFMATAATYGIEISEQFAGRVVAAYREKFPRVKQLWQDQENAVLEAVAYKEEVVETGYVSWQCLDRFLYCTLPSGRRLAYCDPEIKLMTTRWGAKRNALTFTGNNIRTRQWGRQSTYGGMLTENITQAVARDLMADALLRCEQSGIYQPVLSVHDEIIAEADPSVGDVGEFEMLMAWCPAWASGCPIEAKGWSGLRYRK